MSEMHVCGAPGIGPNECAACQAKKENTPSPAAVELAGYFTVNRGAAEYIDAFTRDKCGLSLSEMFEVIEATNRAVSAISSYQAARDAEGGG